MHYLFFCSSKILFHMNVSVLKQKKLVFYIIYAVFWMRHFFFFFFLLVVGLCLSVFHWSVDVRTCPCTFCNNIKRRYGRVNNDSFPVFSISFIYWLLIFHVQKALMNDCRRENFPSRVPAHPYFWQAFDAVPGWVVPCWWPLNGVNTPFTVHISAAAATSATLALAATW